MGELGQRVFDVSGADSKKTEKITRKSKQSQAALALTLTQTTTENSWSSMTCPMFFPLPISAIFGLNVWRR